MTTNDRRREDDGRIDLILSSVQNIQKTVDGVVACLNGNGSPGIKVRLDRVEQRNKRWDWVLKAVAVILLGLLIKDVYVVFHP